MLVKSVVIRSLYQTLYRIWNLKDRENPDEKKNSALRLHGLYYF